ncbi:RNA-directed DNA polymerase, eukaryota, Reverse transcriptase zinc-binding domain protein [Artemisia annua]|uniref:RNA-directed DNA polymerase, eukaryota, Reverse transcriptase zinc-binding domain protein n=1 Tax=Artemisia annua TaxID=35608 RepID=A0A2U1KB03_ARTAN|nr:RNA-directed DNA polymerase, eukaryota, Reverse transcriptase zinc-binding domain protein [Artemisia annua]
MGTLERQVGNGESICFWDDVWLGSSCLSHMFPRLFKLEMDKLCKLKERCSISDGVMEWKWAWRRQIRSGREQEELSNSLSILMNSYLTNDDRDGWRWSMESSGVYSVKSLRATLDEKILPTSSETKWSSLVPKKVCVFIWRAEKDRLPTHVNLDKRNKDLDSLLCPFCEDSCEDLEHSMIASEKDRLPTHVNLDKRNKDLDSLLCPFCEDSCEDLEHSMIACARVKILWEKIFLLWNFQMPVEINIHALLSLVIWNARNRKIFSGIDQTTEWCFSEVQRHSFCWISSRGKVNLNWDE